MKLVIIGGSDAGIMAGLRAKELQPNTTVELVAQDDYPNFSVCGLPYQISGEVSSWQNLAHRTKEELEQAGLILHLNTQAISIDTDKHQVVVQKGEKTRLLSYDKLILATGTKASTKKIEIEDVEDFENVYVMHTMDDLFRMQDDLDERKPQTALIVGGGYVGVEMAEALKRRGLDVTLLHKGSELLPSFDDEFSSVVREKLSQQGIEIQTEVRVDFIDATPIGTVVQTTKGAYTADLILLATGVQPNATLFEEAGGKLDPFGSIPVDEHMQTQFKDVYAAGDCASTSNRQLGQEFQSLGTVAHKQGRVAGANAVGEEVTFKGSLRTQVLKVFDLVIARTGLNEEEAKKQNQDSLSVTVTQDDHKAYYPSATPLKIKLIGEKSSKQLLGAQILGQYGAEVSKRLDILATALFNHMQIEELSDLDLSYTPPLSSPFDPIQLAAQEWEKMLE